MKTLIEKQTGLCGDWVGHEDGVFFFHCRFGSSPFLTGVHIRPLTPFPSPDPPHPRLFVQSLRAVLFVREDFFYPPRYEPCSQLLLIVAGGSHMPKHPDGFNAPLSSADGRLPRLMFLQPRGSERARAAASLACPWKGGTRYRLHLSA